MNDSSKLCSHQGSGNERLDISSNASYSSIECSENDKVLIHLDDSLEYLPIGLYHYKLLAICGLAFASDAIEINVLYFSSVCAGVEWNLSENQQATLIGSVFFGQLIGNIIFGLLADRYGRKTIFILAFGLVAVFGFSSALSSTYICLLILRFIVGLGIGASAVPFDLLSELLPNRYRGLMLCYTEYFWTMGSIYVTVIAWLIGNRWRNLLCLASIPVCLSFVAAIFYLPESPRWLLCNKKQEEARLIIHTIYQASGINRDKYHLALNDTASNIPNLKMKEIKRTNGSVFREWLLLILVWIALGASYNGIILFSSRLYSIQSVTNSDSSTITEAIGKRSCDFDFIQLLIFSCSELIAVFLLTFIINTVGRTKIQSLFYLLTAIFVLFIGDNSNKIATLSFCILSRICIMLATSATWISTSELIETSSRTSIHSICNGLARIAAFAITYLIISSVQPMFISLILCFINLFAAVASTMLTETLGNKLDSISNDIDTY